MISFHVGQHVVYVDSFMPDTVEVITDISGDWCEFNNGSRGCRLDMVRLADPIEIQDQQRVILEDELPFT